MELEDLIKKVEDFLSETTRQIEIGQNSYDLFESFNRALTSVVRSFADDKKVTIIPDWRTTIASGLDFVINSQRIGLWYSRDVETKFIPEKLQAKIGTSSYALNKLFMLQTFLDNVSKVTSKLDQSISSLKQANDELTPIYEKVLEKILPLTAANQLSSK